MYSVHSDHSPVHRPTKPSDHLGPPDLRTLRVGAVVTQGNRYLLVQENHPSVRGLWNLPAGHLKLGETLTQGVLREIKEETGYSVTLTGICQLGQRAEASNPYLLVVFTAVPSAHDLTDFDPEEIQSVKWLTYDEIRHLQAADLIRNPDFLLGAIDNVRQRLVAPLSLAALYTPR